MTYPTDPNFPGGAAPPPPPPPPYGYGYPPPQPPKSSRSWVWVLLGLGAVTAVLCCGGVVGLAYFGFNVMETEIRDQVRDDPVLVEQIGQVESFDVDLTASGAIKDNDTFVYNVKGTKGSGVLTIKHVTDSNGDEVIESAELRTPEGKVHKLKQTDIAVER